MFVLKVFVMGAFALCEKWLALRPSFAPFSHLFGQLECKQCTPSTQKFSHKHLHIGPLQHLESYPGNALCNSVRMHGGAQKGYYLDVSCSLCTRGGMSVGIGVVCIGGVLC
jgi:hypothetical protein